MRKQASVHKLRRLSQHTGLAIGGFLACFTAAGLDTAYGQDTSGRTWRDVTGEYSVVATYLRQTDRSVILLTADGRRINVPIAKLSEPDREFLREQAAAANAPDGIAATEEAITARLKGPPLAAGTIVPLPKLAQMLDIPTFVDVASLRGRRMLVDTPVELGDGFATLQEQLEQALEQSQLGFYRTRTILVFAERRDAERMIETHLYRLRTPQKPGGMQTILQRVEQTEPESWESRGGRGVINEIGGFYVISQSQKVHRLLIKDLKRQPLPQRYSHPLEDVAVTISQSKASLNDVFNAVKEQTGRTFDVRADENYGYDIEEFDRKQLNLDLHEVSAYDLLNVTLAQVEHVWREEGDRIIVEGFDVAEKQLANFDFTMPLTLRLTATDVMQTIEMHAEPDHWEVFGGEGSIQMLDNGTFRVQQGEPAMRAVKRLVFELKAAL